MSPPPDAWHDLDDEGGEEGDYGDEGDRGIGYVENAEEDFYSESDFTDEDSSADSSDLPVRLWPDPFDAGTEASTPATSSRQPSVDLTALPSSDRSGLPEEHITDEGHLVAPACCSREVGSSDAVNEDCGTSSAWAARLHMASVDELQGTLAVLTADEHQKLNIALNARESAEAPVSESATSFASANVSHASAWAATSLACATVSHASAWAAELHFASIDKLHDAVAGLSVDQHQKLKKALGTRASPVASVSEAAAAFTPATVSHPSAWAADLHMAFVEELQDAVAGLTSDEHQKLKQALGAHASAVASVSEAPACPAPATDSQASAWAAKLQVASVDELQDAVAGLTADEHQKLKNALGGHPSGVALVPEVPSSAGRATASSASAWAAKLHVASIPELQDAVVGLTADEHQKLTKALGADANAVTSVSKARHGLPGWCRNMSKHGSGAGGGTDGSMSPSPPLTRPHHGRPRGRQPAPQTQCTALCSGAALASERQATCHPVAEPVTGSLVQLGDFRSCPASFWAEFHSRCAWSSCQPAANSEAEVLGEGFPRRVLEEEDPCPAASPLCGSGHDEVDPVFFYDLEMLADSGIDEDDEDTESDEDDESVEGCFFISTGAPLFTVMEETSRDLGLDDDIPSSYLQAYVAATGALILSPEPSAAESAVAAAQIQKRWRMRCKAKQMKARCASPTLDQPPPPPFSPEPSPEPPTATADEEDEEHCEVSHEAVISEEPGPSTEEVLMARIEAKQVIMSIVLQVILSSQIRQATQPNSIALEAEATPAVTESPTLSLETLAAADADEIPAPPVALEETEGSSEESAPASEEDPLAAAPAAISPPTERPASGKRPIPTKKMEVSRRTGSKEADAAPGRKFIRAPCGRALPSTRPRQPPPRPDKRPPVPRAPRPHPGAPLSASTAAGSEGQQRRQPSGQRGGSRDPATPSSASCSAPSKGVAEESPLCYEVSEEEFGRLLSSGALGDGAEQSGCATEAYEISEEEFDRLLRSGQLQLANEEEETGPMAMLRTPSPDAEGYSEATAGVVEISDEQFEELLLAGALQPDPAEAQIQAAGVVSSRDALAEACQDASIRPPLPTCDPPQTRPPRRHAEPKAPTRPAQPKGAPKRLRVASQAKAEGGGLFFPPTDGATALGSRAAVGGNMAVPFLSSADIASRAQGSRSTSSASSTGVPPASEVSSMDTEELDHQLHDYMSAMQQASAAGAPFQSARLLRDAGGTRNSPPLWTEEPHGQFSQLRASKAPAATNFGAPGKLPLINLGYKTRNDLGFDSRAGGGAPSAPCVFGEDSRGSSPYDDEEDGAYAESRSLPAKLTPSSHESAWPDGMLNFRGSLPRKRTPQKLEPIPY